MSVESPPQFNILQKYNNSYDIAMNIDTSSIFVLFYSLVSINYLFNVFL